MSWEEFVDGAGDNADRMKAFYDGFDFDDEQMAFWNNRTPLSVLGIVEDWCPDVVQNIPVIAKISDEVPGMELALVKRDDNPELMGEFLTNGNRRIPVIVFYDMTFRELGRWTGRCKPADEWIFSEVLDGKRKFNDLSENELKSFSEEYDKRYRDSYARVSIDEWQHLLMDEDF